MRKKEDLEHRPSERLLTKRELEAALACGRSVVDRLIREGAPCLNLGGAQRQHLRFRLERVLKWLEERAERPRRGRPHAKPWLR
jgi:predicted DNA-binding transcriptional regulator AlpA